MTTTAGWGFDVDDDRVARMAWSRLAEPGDQRLAALVQQVGPGVALHALVERDVPWMARYRVRLPELEPERDRDSFARLGGRVVTPADAEWPAALGVLGAPPICLWVRGPMSLDLLDAGSVAVVGARAATAYGEHMAGEIAAGAAAHGLIVVSGLAYGVDGAAHRAAVSAGSSAAVIAGGADRAYPRGHDSLMGRLVAEGAVVSEMPPGSAPTRSRFLQRNRLIAALAAGTVVVEAALRSGALNTARTAGMLGRPVGAVPGPVTSPASAGCHQLVRDGRATVVTDAAEVVELVGRIGEDQAPIRHGEADDTDGLGDTALRVLDALPVRRGRPLDRLCVAAGLDPPTVQAAIGRLALLGLAQRHEGGWRLARTPRRRLGRPSGSPAPTDHS
ncbi:MAG: DNA-processing protein DprA [Angustibacter sp.]